MIAEFKAFTTAFQKGKELANAAVWKNRTLLTNNLGALLGAGVVIAGGFGYTVDVDQETLNAAAGGIAALLCVFNAVMTTVTSSKVGFKNCKGCEKDATDCVTCPSNPDSK